MKGILLILLLLSNLYTEGQIAGYWRLNGNSNDYSGNGYNGSDVDIIYSDSNGRINNGAYFNASSSIINIGDNCRLGTNNFTISFWAKLENSSKYRSIIYKRESVNPYYQYVVSHGYIDAFGNPVSSKNLGIFINGAGGAKQSYRTTNEFADGKWHYFVILKQNGVSAIIYVDGVSVGVTVVNETTKNNINTDTVSNLLFNYRSGCIDEMIFDIGSAWNSAKVKNLYSYYKGFF